MGEGEEWGGEGVGRGLVRGLVGEEGVMCLGKDS